jgi:hypothetical protein
VDLRCGRGKGACTRTLSKRAHGQGALDGFTLAGRYARAVEYVFEQMATHVYFLAIEHVHGHGHVNVDLDANIGVNGDVRR